jgi:hypothetical protein
MTAGRVAYRDTSDTYLGEEQMSKEAPSVEEMTQLVDDLRMQVDDQTVIMVTCEDEEWEMAKNAYDASLDLLIAAAHNLGKKEMLESIKGDFNAIRKG